MKGFNPIFNTAYNTITSLLSNNEPLTPQKALTKFIRNISPLIIINGSKTYPKGAALGTPEFQKILTICDTNKGPNDWVKSKSCPSIGAIKYSDLLALAIFRISISVETLNHEQRIAQIKLLICSNNININYIKKGDLVGESSNLLYQVIFFTDEINNIQINEQSNCIVLFKMLLNKGAKLACNELDALDRPLFDSIINCNTMPLRQSVRLTIMDFLKTGTCKLPNFISFSGDMKTKECNKILETIASTPLKNNLTLNHATLIDNVNYTCVITNKIKEEFYPKCEILLLCRNVETCILSRVPKPLLKLIMGFVVESDVKEYMSCISK